MESMKEKRKNGTTIWAFQMFEFFQMSIARVLKGLGKEWGTQVEDRGNWICLVEIVMQELSEEQNRKQKLKTSITVCVVLYVQREEEKNGAQHVIVDIQKKEENNTQGFKCACTPECGLTDRVQNFQFSQPICGAAMHDCCHIR